MGMDKPDLSRLHKELKMPFRNLSPQRMFEQIAEEHKPQHAFAGNTAEDFQQWKTEVLPKVIATLGDTPEKVPLNAELTAEWEHDGLKKQRWLIDVQKHLSASLLINYPGDIEDDEKRPAILCWHGHGPFGKDPIMGDDTSPELRDEIDRMNYIYGHEMAKAGFVTYAIDWIGMGEHNDNLKPNFRNMNESRDWCNLYYLHATMLGTTSIAINVHHGKAATDFVSSLPSVDEQRLGIMGLSGGGTMTLWSTLCDERFKAAEIIGYSGLYGHFGISDIN